MGFKENLEQRKERKEAMEYFRQNNDAYMSLGQYIKVIFFVLIGAIGGAIIQSIFTLGTGIQFGFFYYLGAYFICMMAKKSTKMVNDHVLMICMIVYVLMVILGKSFLFSISIYGINGIFYIFLDMNIWRMAINSLLVVDPIGWFIYVSGGYELYRLLR